MLRVLLLVPYSNKLILRDYFCSSISKAGYYWQPIDFLVLSGKLKKDFEIFVLDIPLEKLSYKTALNKALSFNAHIIIFLSGNLSWEEDFEFVKKLKTKNNKIFGIGETFLEEPQKILNNYPFIDGVILDFTHSQIKEFILNSGQFNNILSPEKNKSFCYPMPFYEKFKLKKYNYPFSRYKMYASILTNYGCPYKCKFCNSGSLGFKLRDIDNIFKELFYVRNKLNIKQIFIKDMTFAASRQHSLEFLKELIKNKLNVIWNCYTRVDVLDEELIYYMKRAGCYLVQLGIEHKDTQLLSKVGKSTKLEDVCRTVTMLKKYNILIGAHFIFGLPEEKIEMVKETVKFVHQLKPDYVSFNIFTPRKGSVLGNLFIGENKFIKSIVKRGYLSYYFSIGYILKRIFKFRTFYELKNIIFLGFNFVKNLIKTI